MDDKQVRQIVQEELRKQFVSGRSQVAPHLHDGISNLKLNQKDINPKSVFNGTITMSQSTVYTIPVTGNPASVTFYGGALNTTASPALHAMVVGSAQFGQNYQFQPGTATSVGLNNIQENIIQGSAALVVSNAGTSILRNSQGHIVYASDASNNIYAIATITSFSNTQINITVSLASNWSISGLWIVT